MDDDELMMLVQAALAADEKPTPRALAAAADAFRWLCVDDELADVVFDSADSPMLRGARAGRSCRLLTYRSDDLLIDCEIHAGALFGQVVPAMPVTLELRSPDGRHRPLAVDGQGSFMVEPTPAGPLSIRCLRAGRQAFITPWVLA
jgi:hypothetical protein